MKKIESFYLIILFTISVLLMFDTIFYGFVSDDFSLVSIDFREAISSSLGVHFRPLWHLSYPFLNLISSSSYSHHIFNIVLFILSIYLAYKYINVKKTKLFSFISVLIWITLPWMVFPVTWISQRNDLLMIVFVLMSLIQFEKQKTYSSMVFLFFGFLSKVNCFLLPLYFIFKSFKKSKSDFYKYILIQIVFFLISLRSYLVSLNLSSNIHLKNLSFQESIMNKIVHLFTGVTTQLFPIPYFTSKTHFGLYLLLFLFGLYLVINNKNPLLNFIKKNYDYLILFIIFCFPLIINSELRISTFTSLFLIVSIGGFSRFKLKPSNIILISLIIINNIYSGYKSKSNFKTEIHNLDFTGNYRPTDTYYNNKFYQEKRIFLSKIKRKLNGEENLFN